MSKHSFLIPVVLCFLFSCTPLVQKRFCTHADIQRSEKNAKPERQKNPCYDYLNYAPDTNHLDHFQKKFVRINFHLMNSRDSLWNFPESKGVEWAMEYLKAVNYALENNKKAILPEGNEIPILPIGIQYLLSPRPGDSTDDGIYFHYDDDLFYYVSKGGNINTYDKEVFNKYGIQKDSVLNIFLMPHHPDSLNSPTYGAFATGVALGNFIKIAWNFSKTADLNPWEIRGTFNHEVAHIFGLVHAWSFNDGCEDTPQHSLDTLSSNVMDYNSSQLSYTPCQIGKMHQRLSTVESSARKLLQPDWCALNESKNIVIRDSVNWFGQKDLEGNLTIAGGGVLKIHCRVSIPKGGKITIEPGGFLILEEARIHNSCGDTWLGIEIQELKNEKGTVVFIGDPKLEDMENELK